MCFKTISRWLEILFDNGNVSVDDSEEEQTPPPPQVPGTLTIPHPEESPDPTKTIDNTDLNAAMDRWTVDYDVPEIHRGHWKTQIVITLDDTLPYPAGAYELNGIRHLTIRPEWVNSGVIAHEQAHNSYALLTDGEKANFSATFTPLKTSVPLIAYLFSINTYGLTNDIEGHAEVYRYLGEEMPEELKKYYPKLF